MNKVCIIAPHPDDETLGCGGTILNHKELKDKIYWICATSMKASNLWSKKNIERRDKEINMVIKAYGFDSFQSLDFPPKELDRISLSEIIDQLTMALNKIKPNILYVPFFEDAHSDHKIIGDTYNALGKWFRYPYIKKIICYETISETNFNIISKQTFRPNKFVDISSFMSKKIKIMKIYKSELGKHPFPRSVKAIEALGILRGSQSGFKYAEAFKTIIDKS
jgi:N-acetylglucosamine malate deacetylase 1